MLQYKLFTLKGVFMKFKTLRRVIAALVCVCMIICIPFSASALSVSQMQSEIKRLEAEAKELQNEINGLRNQQASQQKIKDAYDRQIANLQKQINVCIDRIDAVEAEIAESERVIKQKNAEIEESKKQFKKRIRAIYMSNTGSNVQILLGAENFSDFLALSELTRDVSARDKKLINDIVDTISQIQAEIKKNEERIAEQDAIRKDLDAKQSELEKQAAAVQGVINSIASDKNSLEADKKKLENQMDNYMLQIAQQSSGSSDKYDGSAFKWPVPGFYWIISGFGPRWSKHHSGIDITGSGIYGAKIVASANGTVQDISNYCNHYSVYGDDCGGGWGRYVMIDHGRGSNGSTYKTLYAHMSRVAVGVGQKVKKGQVIGYVGSTGSSTGPHLHYEVYVNGSRVDPENYVGTSAK